MRKLVTAVVLTLALTAPVIAVQTVDESDAQAQTCSAKYGGKCTLVHDRDDKPAKLIRPNYVTPRSNGYGNCYTWWGRLTCRR